MQSREQENTNSFVLARFARRPCSSGGGAFSAFLTEESLARSFADLI